MRAQERARRRGPLGAEQGALRVLEQLCRLQRDLALDPYRVQPLAALRQGRALDLHELALQVVVEHRGLNALEAQIVRVDVCKNRGGPDGAAPRRPQGP